MAIKSLQGFNVISLRFSSTSSAQHELFIKQHSVRNQTDDKPADRTIFVLNVPPYVTKESFLRLFSCVGVVKNVIFQDKPGGEVITTTEEFSNFKVAYVIFEKSASVAKALKLTNLELSSEDEPVLTGVKKWLTEYNNGIYSHATLQKQVDKFMKEYDKKVAVEKQREKREQTDEEGWTVVTKKGRHPGLSNKESVKNKLNEKSSKRSSKKELKDFYTFQIRESKMQHIAQLRKKYEEDKKKIAAMKQARKFRPY